MVQDCSRLACLTSPPPLQQMASPAKNEESPKKDKAEQEEPETAATTGTGMNAMGLLKVLTLLICLSNTYLICRLQPRMNISAAARNCSNVPSQPVECPEVTCPKVKCPEVEKKTATATPRLAWGPECRKRPHASDLVKSGRLTVTFPFMTKGYPVWDNEKDYEEKIGALYAMEPVYKKEWARQGVEEVYHLNATFIVSKQSKIQKDGIEDEYLMKKLGMCQEWGRHQVFNHIARSDRVAVKSRLAETFNRLAKNLPHKAEDVSWLIPKTLRLEQLDECEEFGKRLDEGMWIHKIDHVHNSNGVTLLDKETAKEKAANCSAIHAGMRQRTRRERRRGLGIVQSYIKKPFLIEEKKCDFRIYFYVASTDPYITFWSPEFYIRCGHAKYVPNSTDPLNVITNTKVKGQVRTDHGAKWEDVVWGPQKFQDYLTSKGYPSDWLQNDFVKQMNTKMGLLSHVLDPTLSPHLQGSGYEIFGLDFMLDEENMNFWVIEVNFSPELMASRAARKFAVKNILKTIVGTQIDLMAYAASGKPRSEMKLSDLPSRGSLHLVNGFGVTHGSK
eukprot:TRINITY_DN3973_c3_g2_i1.p1 TRINITY_DN3973_c3_g2~~TRINITY_DN3973_c3_g2_i1.p1  ORF type:complete len:560 (-),score=85.14 TRINITY_DN3973_c3_g2_i1:517-2196(-)